MVSLLAIILLLIFLIRIPSVQNYVVGKVTDYLENKIGTPVDIGYINITFPKNLVLENIYFEDQSQDTLIAGEKLLVDINMFKLLKNTVEINDLQLKGITAKINRTLPDSSFNFDYIMQAFSTEEESDAAADTTSALIFNMDKVLLERIHFVYNDEVIGTSADISLRHFDTRIKRFDLSNNMSFSLPNINLDGLSAFVKQWAPTTGETAPAAEDFGITPDSNSDLLPDIDLRNIKLSRIDITYQDSSSAMDTKFVIDQLSAKIDKIDLNEEIVRLDEMTLNGSNSEIRFGAASKITEGTNDPMEETNDTTEMNWVVSAKKLTIDNTAVWYKDDNQPPIRGFDYSNIRISDFNGDLSDLYYSKDSLSGSLKSLTAKDHSGFQLSRLQGDFIYTSTGAKIENLLAETPRTLIRDFIEINYPSIEELSDNPERVSINANIRKSHLDMRDVLFFVPELDTMEVMNPLLDKKFFVHGRVQGRLNNLSIPNLELSTLSKTQILASATIRGLPDPDKMYIDLTLNRLITGKSDLDQLIAKSMMPDSIQFPNSISLAGSFSGGMTGFATDLQLITEKGSAQLDGNINMDSADTTYSAYVKIEDFDLGNLLNQDSVLGIIAAEANISGVGLDPKTMQAEIDGSLQRLDAMGYRYHDVTINGTAKEGDIFATINSPDPNIQFNMDLHADMRNAYPQIVTELIVDSVNLQNLHIMEDNFRYHGKLVANFETADPDFLNGYIHIVNSSIAYNDERFVLDTIALVAEADSNRNSIVLNSAFLNAHLVGKYKITELNKSIQDIVNVYYNPKNTILDSLNYTPQNFEFSAQLSNSRFIRDFIPELQEMQDITLDGRFESESKTIMAKLVAPKVIYDGTEINNVGVDVITVDSTMYYSALIEKVKVGNIELINSILSGEIVQNNINIGLWIKDKFDKEQYHLGAKVVIDDENYVLSLLRNGLMLNYDTWEIDTANQLSFGKDGIYANNFQLRNEGQELMIQSQDSIPNSPLDLSFDNFRIETFSKILETEDLNFGGGLNGTATLSRLESNPVFVSDLSINKFYFGQDTIGDIIVNVDNEQENTFAADIRITENGNNVQLVGSYFAPPSGESSLQATLELKPLKMSTVQAFSFGSLQKSEGEITGVLNISGNLDQPKINGDLLFDGARINASMLNADFWIDQQKLTFNNQGITLKNFEIKDNRGNLARINGTVATQTYTDFKFNLNLTSNDFEVVNSTREDNDMFYGKMYVTSALKITGDLNNPSIDGDVKANEKTDFVFVVPNDNPGITERDGVVKFVNRSDTTQTNVFARLDSMTTVTGLSGFDLAINLQTDRDAKFKIVLDEGTDEALHIRGVAEINAAIDASEKITMSGTFTVEDGDYSFNFGPITRDFTFQQGSTITWNGDPLDARMDITAVYNNKFPTLELVQTQIGPESQNLYKQRIPFDVKLILSGELFNPNIAFDIDLDENNAIVSQDVVSKVNIALSSLREDPAELNKQVFSLIILGRFMSSNPFESLSGGGGAEGIARNSVTSFLNSQLNALASDLITGVELDFNLQSEQDYLTGTGQNRTDLNIGISKMLFDDRLKITVGSNFEVEGASRPGEKANNIAGDISLDYQLSKDGRYFARVYRKNQYQATLQGQYVETGIGFVINMSYNKFRELFMNSRALDNYYNTESRGFRRRFDVERMEVDSTYRDSVRQVIRDSLMLHNPKYRERLEQRREEEQRRQEVLDSTENSTSAHLQNDSIGVAIRNEEEERKNYED